MFSQTVSIPDTAFLYALIDEGVDTNGDSLISYAEAEIKDSLNVRGLGITDMAGIEAFVNLEYLSCGYNEISVLDVSKNAALEYINCNDNLIAGLDLSSNLALVELWCENNPITYLDISSCNAIETLDCSGTLLRNLDISNNQALTTLLIDSTPTLTEVCVWTIPFPPNGIDVADWSCPNLYYTTDCVYNNDSIVFIPDTAFLQILIHLGVDTSGDSLISHSEAEAIAYLSTNNTPNDVRRSITDMTGIEAFVNLDTLVCSSTPLLTNLDVSCNTKLKLLNCTNMFASVGIGSLSTLSINTGLESLICRGNNLTTLDISNNTSLTVLECSFNQLTTLDVSTNTSLEFLDCVGNKLNTLDVSSPVLTYLNCGSNLLTNLNVSGCIILKVLVIWINQITSLDVSNNTSIEYLNCRSNKLTSLDVSNNPILEYLNCDCNQLTRLDLSNNNTLKMIKLRDSPNLHEVCVWIMPFPPEGVDVNTEGSPNVEFKNCSSTGIEGKNHIGLSFYPNPTNSLLTIETGISDHYSIEITSLSGKLILSKETEGPTYQIDLSSFQKGIYFITIRSNEFIATRKIIKL